MIFWIEKYTLKFLTLLQRYNLREKVNEHFIGLHHPVDPEEIDLIEVQTANQGTTNNSVSYTHLTLPTKRIV